MIVDKEYWIPTKKHKDTLCARIYLDKELLRTLQTFIFSEISEAAAPEDLTDYDDIFDRVNYINDLSESLNNINDAIYEIESKEAIENIPEDEDGES